MTYQNFETKELENILEMLVNQYEMYKSVETLSKINGVMDELDKRRAS